MAYNYLNQTQQNFPQFQTQQMFPQPSGNVYNISNSLEVANVPTGAGVSVALCMPENLMCIKTMQNGSPLFWTYRLSPYTEENKKEQNENQATPARETVDYTKLFEDRLNKIESQLTKVIKDLGVDTNE